MLVKHRDGAVEALRALRVARNSAMKARRAALQLLRNAIVSAPDRGCERSLYLVLPAWRSSAPVPPGAQTATPPTIPPPHNAHRPALSGSAHPGTRRGDRGPRRTDHSSLITPLVEQINPRLTEASCVGTEIAAQLLVTAGENPERMKNEAAFAMLCGVAPLPASSGKTCRYRLNRGGDRGQRTAHSTHGGHKSPSGRPWHPRLRSPTRGRRTLQEGDPALPKTLPGS